MIVTIPIEGKKGKKYTIAFSRSGLPENQIYVEVYEGEIKTNKVVGSTLVNQDQFKFLQTFMDPKV